MEIIKQLSIQGISDLSGRPILPFCQRKMQLRF